MLLFLAVAMFLLAYFTRYIVFEVTSIAALLTGFAFVFASVDSYVKARPANLSVRGPLMSLHQSLVSSGYAGRAFYFPGGKGEEKVKMFIPNSKDDSPTNLASLKSEQSARGIWLTPPGEGIAKILGEELDGLSDKELKYLVEWVPRAIVEGLGLAEKMKMQVKGDDVRMEIHRPSFQILCQDAQLNQTVCLRFGCPFSSGIATALAESTERVVEFVTCGHDSKSEKSTGFYRLGAQSTVLNPEQES